MPLFGNIIVIKRNGTDGISFPLTASSCLFGRRTECDIRIQLPQVSKEHCKIEVNENKEAILTNLSTVNPTQLNGGCFQQPVPLKHGDVLTIIDRSFRFEYPLQSTPRKKRSRSPKDETLQVLHVQQVAEVELLHKQTSGSKSLHASDNAECEEKNANENKQSTEEKTCKALPVKLQTPKSAHRIHLSSRRQSEMSPFSKLYEKLKCEIKVKKTLQEGNVCQQAAKEDGKTVLLEPSARTSSSCVYDLGSLTKEKERSRSENIEECKIKQEVICSEFNQISAVGSATRKSFTRSPRTSISKETPRHAGERNHLQDRKELSTEGSSKSTEVTTKSSKENDANAAFPLKPCIIECLDCADKIKIHSSPAAVAKLAQMTNTINVSEVDKYVLSTPTSRRRSPRSHFISPTKETSGVSPVYTDTPTTQRRVSLKCKSFSEILAETQREDSVCGNDSLKQLPLAENECLKQRRNSKQRTPGRSVKEEVLKEICDQANFVNSKEECSETPVSLSNSKSPRRSNRQSKELSNTGVHLETPAAEELTSELSSTASPKSDSGRQRGRPRTSGLQTEKALETSAVQEHPSKTPDGNDKGAKEDLATKGHHQKQDLEDACDMRPRRLSSRRRSSGSAAVLKGNEAVSEMNVSGLLAGGESGKTKMLSQKRKSGGLLLQPLEKRKRVSFGGHLSPELFDKSLPPNSPIKRGAIPARLSLPFGNSPRAVLKKAQGLKRFTVQELSEHLQKETMSPKHLPAWKSPAASSPASGKATPTLPLGSPALFTKGRFSVSHITTPSPIAEEKDAVAENLNTKEKNDPQVKTPKSSHVHQDDKTSSTTTPDKLTKSAQVASKVTPMRRSGAVAVINAKRRSGASSANLLVAKSWAEVVKLGVARPQSKTVKKSVRKGSSLKKKTKSPKTPKRKIKGHFSTGHAESPATIVVGRAYSTTVRTVGQVPKVVKNPIVKLNMNMDESFTGIAEMFQTPENKSGKTLPLASVQKTDFTPTCTAVETSELQTPEESGEMMVSPLNSSDASEQKQDSPDIFHFQIEESVKCVFDTLSMKTPEKIKAMLGENVSVASLSIIPEKEISRLKSGSKRRTPKQKSEPVEDLPGIKQLRKTPKRTLEPVEALSGIKELMRTPKRKPEPIEVLLDIKQLRRTPKRTLEPVEALSGIKELMRTPKRKPEPTEVLSGIKQLMKTPKQKPEPIEVLSGIKQLMKTPKRKSEPIEDLSGIKQLTKTPKRKPEPIEDLSGIKQLMKTPKRKPEPIEDLSGIKQLMKTPKQKPEPIEVLSGIKELMRTPKQKPEPIEVLSGIKELMRTPKRKPEPIEVLSGIKQLMKTPQQELEPVTGETGFQRLLKTPVQEGEAVKDVAGVTLTRKTPKLKYQPVEDTIGVSRIFKTPEENVEPIGVEPIEDIFDMSTLVKAPREKYQPADDFVGLQRLMAEPKQKCSDFKVDYVGLAELFEIPEETKVGSGSVPDSEQEDTAPPCTNSSHKYEDKGNVSPSEDSQQRESTSEDDSTQRPTKGRSRKTKVHPASAKQCEKNLNSKELQSLEKKSTQEEMEEISTSTSAAKNRGRGRRANRCIQEETVSQHPDPEEVEIDSFVEGLGATRRAGRGKGKKTAELKHAGESLESCGKASSVVQKQRANRKQTLQEYGFNGILETEDDPAISSSIQNENCQLQTGLKRPENKPKQGGVEDSEEMLLWPRRSGGIKEVENTESLIPPKGAKRARNISIKQASSQDLPGTRRQLRKGPSAKIKGDKQTFNKDTKTATAEKSESGTKLKIKITEKRLKSLRSARKHSTELKADICEMALENLQNIPKIKETSTETGTETQSHIKNEIKVSQGDTAEALSGIKELMRTPKRKPEPIEVLSGIKQLMKTPQQELEPVTGETGFQRLLKTPVQEGEAVKDVAGVTLTRKTPKLKYQPVEDTIGVSRIFKTPEENVEPIGVEPIEDIFDMSTLVKAPREKYQPADDFVGLQRLMAEPKQKCSDFKVDYVGLAELFEIPEETKVGSGSVPDSEQEDTAPPCTNSSHKYEDKGNVSPSEDSQQRESTSEDDSTQRPTKGRSRKTKVHPASAKQCEKNLNSKELQSLEKKSTQEEMEEISTSTSAAKNRGRGRRANRCIQEETVSQHPDPEEVEIDSFVEGLGATRRAGRGKGKKTAELKHAGESLESCGKASSVVQNQRANRKQTLQEYGFNGILETEDDPAISSSIQNENCQLQTGLKRPENKPKQGGVEDSEEMPHFFIRNKVPAADSYSPALKRRKQAGNEQGILKPKQTEIPQENQAQKNGTACRRGRGRKVNFELEEASSKAAGGKWSLPEDDKGMTCKDGQRETSENPSLQLRRSRRKLVVSIPQVACSDYMENQTLIAGHSKDEAFVKEQYSSLFAAPSSTQENPLRRGKRREVAAASQTSRSLPVRRRHGLPEGDDKKTTVREDQNPALGNKTLQVKTNASVRDARKKIDLAAEAGSSSSIQRKFDLSETDDKEEGTNEEQNMSLETVSCAKEKPLGRGRRKETALASHTTNHISLRGKRHLPADNGREAAPKEYQNVPLETFDSPVKENQLRRGRRKGIALLLEATSSIQGKQGLSKESSRKKKLILDNPETPEEQQNILLAVALSAKGNPSRVGRKRRISSKSEETTSAFLRENPFLPINRCKKGILKKQEVNPIQQATSSSRTRKCQFAADDLASKKSKSENDENGSLQKGRRNKAKEQLGEEGVRATRTTGRTDRKTRSSTRTSARARK
ncbi:proliferation marker protein Ki-67 [Strix aluco]